MAFSVSENPGEAHQIVNRRKKYLAVIEIELFRWGIGFLAVGFALQIVGNLFGNPQ